jgi:purine-binding chemotaxis protein CheW
MEEADINVKEEKEPYIIFEVAGTFYGIKSLFVQQLEMIENITPVPNTPGYIDGVMFSRGKVIPVINLRVRFGLEKISYDVKTRVIVVRLFDRNVGLVADSAKEYLKLLVSSIQPAPDFVSELASSWLSGIAVNEKRTILILNVEELMSTEENHKVTING